jgi:hypothetical protein
MAAIIVQGTTAPLTFQLLENAAPLDLTGLTVTLLLNDAAGTAVTTTGKVAVTGTTTGIVTFTPLATDMTAVLSPYSARWVLTSGSQVSYVPTGYRDIWNVVAT